MAAKVPRKPSSDPTESGPNIGRRLIPQWILTKAQSVSLGTWVFGSVLLLFLVCVFALAPNALPEFRLRLLAVLSALLAGIFGFFLTGDVGLNLGAAQKGDKKNVKWEIKATGGFALFVIVLYWWFSPLAPIDAIKAIKEIKLDTAKAVMLLENELHIRNDQIILLQQQIGASRPPVPTERARELAKLIQDNADSYALALKAIAESRFEDARMLLERAQREKEAELSHIYITRGYLDIYKGSYLGSTAWFQKANSLWPDDPVVMAQTAFALQMAGKYSESEPLYRKALAIQEKQLAPNASELANCLNDLGTLCLILERLDEASSLFLRALAIREKEQSPTQLWIANSLNNLAVLSMNQGKYADSERLYKLAIAIREKELGPEHPDLARALNNLAVLYRDQGRYADAEPLFKRALDIREKKLGPDHPEVAKSLNAIAKQYYLEGKYVDAEPLFKRAMAICEKKLGPESADVEMIKANYVKLLFKMHRNHDAQLLDQKAKR